MNKAKKPRAATTLCPGARRERQQTGGAEDFPLVLGDTLAAKKAFAGRTTRGGFAKSVRETALVCNRRCGPAHCDSAGALPDSGARDDGGAVASVCMKERRAVRSAAIPPIPRMNEAAEE